jgi:hypothetical protein
MLFNLLKIIIYVNKIYMNYTQKYIKYKTKYLNLKKIINGGSGKCDGLDIKAKIKLNMKLSSVIKEGCKIGDFSTLYHDEDREKLRNKLRNIKSQVSFRDFINAGYKQYELQGIYTIDELVKDGYKLKDFKDMFNLKSIINYNKENQNIETKFSNARNKIDKEVLSQIKLNLNIYTPL